MDGWTDEARCALPSLGVRPTHANQYVQRAPTCRHVAYVAIVAYVVSRPTFLCSLGVVYLGQQCQPKILEGRKDTLARVLLPRDALKCIARY